MSKKAVSILTLGLLFLSFSQAEALLTESQAEKVALELIQRTVEYCSAHPERAGSIPDWRGTKLGDPILVHGYPGLKPCYYVVPVMGLENSVISLIGTSAEEPQWRWFNGARLERFPGVSQDKARRTCEEIVAGAKVSHPLVVEMPNKKLYWLCLPNAGGVEKIFVNLDDASDIHTSLDADISQLTTTFDPAPAGVRDLRPDGARPESRNPSYPESYNIENVPFHFQETSWYCGMAALQMVFDYWGPLVSQDDIGDVANESSSYGSYSDDLRRASHFSYVSTAVQNPLLQGYDERDLGYSGNVVYWSDGQHYDDRYDDLKNLIWNDYPILVLTWYSASHSSGHYRVVKGYDDWLNYFIVHDPWYSSPYFGPDEHFNQEFFVDDLWAYSGRWGLQSAPWEVELSVPSFVYTGDTITVSLNFSYTAPYPFEGQYHAGGISATLSVPAGYILLSPGSPTVDFGSGYSGLADDTSWQVLVLSESPTPDTFGIEVKGHISGSCGSYPSYEDWIGGQAEAATQAVLYIRGDVNRDYLVDIGDVVFLVNYLYKSGPAPEVEESGDANSDGVTDIGDVVYLVNYLYKAGPPPSD
jgi:hypothetical protein